MFFDVRLYKTKTVFSSFALSLVKRYPPLNFEKTKNDSTKFRFFEKKNTIVTEDTSGLFRKFIKIVFFYIKIKIHFEAQLMTYNSSDREQIKTPTNLKLKYNPFEETYRERERDRYCEFVPLFHGIG